MIHFMQIPSAAAGDIERWILSGAAVLSFALLGKKFFGRKTPVEAEFVSKQEFKPFRRSVEGELGALRDRLDARFFSLAEKLDQTRNDLLRDNERRTESLHNRISELESGLARVDERTRE
jgi:hypothetical protein